LRRSGFLLLVVGGLILLIGIGSMMFHRAARQQYLDAHRFASATIAAQLAESGLNASLERFLEATQQPGTELHDLLLSRSAGALNGTSLNMNSPFLDDLLLLLGGGASISVSVKLDHFRPLTPSAGLRGLLADEREKAGEIKLVSEASFRGIQRRIVASKRIRVVSIVAPVVSKFTLFVRTLGDESLNSLKYSRLAPEEGFTLLGEEASPLTLFHGGEQIPAVEGGRLLPLQDVLTERPPDQGGLVYLGGRKPWFLHLVHGIGAGPFEELFHLRRARYLFESPLPGVTKEIGMYFGFYDGLLDSKKFASMRSPNRYPRGNNLPDVVDQTSLLHLYGDIHNVSPTLVLGPAFRSYVTMRLLDGLWYPTQTASEFSQRNDQSLFPKGYESYREVMVRVQDESYNRSYDFLTTNQEVLQEGGGVTSNGTPFLPAPSLTEDRLQRVQPAAPGDSAFLYPQPDQEVAGLCRLIRQEQGGGQQDLFRGALADLDGDVMEQVLRAKAVVQVPNQEAFRKRFLVNNTLQLPGVVLIREGDLNLADVNSGKGGMVVVQGGIEVRGKVVQTQPHHPLTLVSLSGDIHLRSDEKLDVALIALRGTVTSRGRLELVGSLAAHHLPLSQIVRGPESKRITYNQDLDPTAPENQWAHLRVILDKRVNLYLE
jgi:hypothetical protein